MIKRLIRYQLVLGLVATCGDYRKLGRVQNTRFNPITPTHGHFVLSPVSLALRDQHGGPRRRTQHRHLRCLGKIGVCEQSANLKIIMEMYFGFASSLSERKMKERGARFLSRESAVLTGFRLEFSSNWKDDGFGYANIVLDEGSQVHGALYACEKGTWASLDREHIDEGNRFRRVIVQIETKNGEAVNAVAYQANKEFVNKQLKPSEAYLNEILEGEDIIPKGYAEYIRSFKGGIEGGCSGT